MHEIKGTPISTGNLVDENRFVISDKTIHSPKFKGLIVTYYPNFIKDMDTFFETMSLLKKQNLNSSFEFTIVGGGELQGEYNENFYKQIIEKRKLNEFVKVIPSASRDEMVQLIQDHHVFQYIRHE
jgi:hypothetical protein